MKRKNLLVFGIALGLILTLGQAAVAKDKKAIDADVAAALGKLDQDHPEAAQMMQDAKGTLVCPKLGKVGFGIGVSGGACALLVDGTATDYFRTGGVSFGLTAGIESHGLALIFNSQEELEEIRNKKRGWEAGIDGSVAVAKKGASGSLNTTQLKKADVVAIPFSKKGLMADFSVAGSTFKKIDPMDFDGLLYTFVATAEVTDATSRNTTANLRFAIDRWNTEAERQHAIRVLRDDGDMIAAMGEYDEVGRVSQPGDKSIPLLYAYQKDLGNGKFKVILGTTEPIGFGVQRQLAKDSKLAIIELDLNNKGTGTGVLNQGSVFSFDDKREVVVIDKVTIKPVRLDSVSAKAN